MNRKHLAILAVAVAGAAASNAALAHGGPDVRWSVTIGAPGFFVAPPVFVEPPVFVARPVYAPRPIYVAPSRYVVVRRGDRDHDGIPDRYDRVYNPRWDRDGDGIPNRYDHHDNRRGPYRGY